MSGAARFPDGVELRAATELRAAGRKLAGYAAVFGAAAQVGGFTETIAPGAFRAGYTLCFGALKPGLLAVGSAQYTGLVRRVDIGL